MNHHHTHYFAICYLQTFITTVFFFITVTKGITISYLFKVFHTIVGCLWLVRKYKWYKPACLIIRLLFWFSSDSVFVKLNKNITNSAGRHNLRRFLATNSTQNYFLIARMLRFLWHSRQKCRILTFCDKRWQILMQKWREREEMEREWGNGESHSLSVSSFYLHFLFISSFSLHFLFISSFSLHFLAAWLQGCSGLWHPVPLYII